MDVSVILEDVVELKDVLTLLLVMIIIVIMIMVVRVAIAGHAAAAAGAQLIGVIGMPTTTDGLAVASCGAEASAEQSCKCH